MSGVGGSEKDSKMISEIWDGMVAVQFDLDPREVTSLESPVPYFMLLPRQSYLPLLTQDVRAHFLASAPAREDEMWFDHSNIPLKWNLPVGVLYDLLVGRDTKKLPLQITVHFQGFPAKSLLRCKSVFTVRSLFMNTLKEAMAIKYGTSRTVASLSTGDQTKLWDSVNNTKYDSYEPMIRRITNSMDRKVAEHLPVRIVINGFNDEYAPTVVDFVTIQQPIKPEIDGVGQTLETLVRTYAPGLVFVAENPNSAAATSPTAASPSVSSTTTALSSSDKPVGSRRSDVEVLVQGMAASMSTPLQYLCDNCSHPDGFLYVCIVHTRPHHDDY